MTAIDPSTLNPFYYWRADYRVGLTSGKVSAWTDIGSAFNAVKQTDSARQPTIVDNIFGNNPGMLFNGSTDILTIIPTNTAKRPTSTAGTVMCIVKPTGVLPNERIAVMTGKVSSIDNRYVHMPIRDNDTQPYETIQVNNGTLNNLVGDTQIDTATQYTMVWSSSGTAYKFRVNGVEQTLTVLNGSDNGNWFGDVSGLNEVDVGGFNFAGAGPLLLMQGYIGMLIMFNSQLSDAQMAGIEEYMEATTWGDPPATQTMYDEMGTQRDPARKFVWTDENTGYVFYQSGNTNLPLVYRKTTDAGLTWGNQVNVFGGHTGIWNGSIDVWYDQWTPGNVGTKIHIAYNAVVSGVFPNTVWHGRYISLDTATDTLSSVVSLASETQSSTGGQNISIAVAKNGNIYVAGTYSPVSHGFWRSTDGGSSFSTLADYKTNNNDYIELHYGGSDATDDVWAILWKTTGDIVMKAYDNSGSSFSEGALETASGTHVAGTCASVVHPTNDHLYALIWPGTSVETKDIHVYDITGVASITQRANLADAVVTSPGLAIIAVQPFAGLIYGCWADRSVRNVFYRGSGGGGASWSNTVQFNSEDGVVGNLITQAPIATATETQLLINWQSPSTSTLVETDYTGGIVIPQPSSGASVVGSMSAHHLLLDD